MPVLSQPVRVRVIQDSLPHAGREGLLTEILVYFTPVRGIIKLDDGKEMNGNFIIISLSRLDPVDADPSVKS